jgi:hypothetical protein
LDTFEEFVGSLLMAVQVVVQHESRFGSRGHWASARMPYHSTQAVQQSLETIDCHTIGQYYLLAKGLALADRLPEQEGGRGLAVRNDINVHAYTILQ